MKNTKRLLALITAAFMLAGCQENGPAAESTTPGTSAPASPAAVDTQPTTPETTVSSTEAPRPALSETDIEMYIEEPVFPLGTVGFSLKYRYTGSAENAEYCFGCEYTLEKSENGAWREIALSENAVFISLGYLIGSESTEQATPVSLSDSFYAEPLTEGKYRVKKELCGLTLYAEFELYGAGPVETTTAPLNPEPAAPDDTVTMTTTAAAVPPVSEEAQDNILLISRYDNYAWGYQQAISVVSADGRVYSVSAESEEEGLKLSGDGWYSVLVENVINSGSSKKADAEIIDELRGFSAKLPEYAKRPLKQYGDIGMCDYGDKTLYGVYTDENGKAVKLELASFGDGGAFCIDSAEVRDFVNKLIEYGLFSMTGYVFGKDGNVHEMYELYGEDDTITLTIDEITKDYFRCQLPWPYPADYYVECNTSEYPDYCVGDTVEVYYSTMYRKYDDDFEYIIYPFTISESGFSLEADTVYKPVIYLYPEKETEVSVKLDYKGRLTVTYPEYGDGWSVTARPDGTLFDKDGNEYSYLFWEGKSDTEYDLSTGFCVKGSDTAAFLREKLSLLGLTPREYNEFIVFWLPFMQDNEYNVISFQTDRYTDSAVLSVTPEPDTVIRVFMAFYPSGKPVDIPEQKLEPAERKGFTVVEWGGCGVR